MDGEPEGTSNYSYAKGFGDVTSYRLEGAAEPAAEFDYDAFGRQTRAERGTKVEDFSYDGLDRRDTRQVGTRFFDLSYVGLSEALSQESQFEGGDERRSYDYTSGLERVGTVRKPDGVGGDAPYHAYSLDANGSVEGLQDDSGDDSDQRYFYDPYGQALSSDGDPMDDADEAALPEDQQANPFRFQSHYYDAAGQSYDMKARAYLPEIGRFLQEDHYEQASGDRALETDPLTQDRYAFAGGNPVDNIEFDGHRVCNGAHDCGGSSREASRRNSNFENQKAVFSPTEQIQWNNAVNEGAREARSRSTQNRRAAAAAALSPRNLLPSCTPGACEHEDGHGAVLGFLSSAADAGMRYRGEVIREVEDSVVGFWDTAKACSVLTGAAPRGPDGTCGSVPSTEEMERRYTRGDPAKVAARWTVVLVSLALTRRPSSVAAKGGRETQNIANGPRLGADLARREATSVFDDAGRLHPEVIRNSQQIVPGQNLKNPAVIRELTRNGSNIADWGKYTSPTLRSPSRSFQVHFYRNRATGEVNYNIDYKVVFTGRRP